MYHENNCRYYGDDPGAGGKRKRLAVSDTELQILFAQAALEGLLLIFFINTKMMKDQEEAERLNYLADQLIATGKELKETTYDAVRVSNHNR